MENLIIEIARDIVKKDFMQYSDFDDDLEFTLKDALTVLICNDRDIESDEVFDFINSLF